MRLRLGLALLAGSLTLPASASAAVAGTISVTGTDGGENVRIVAANGYENGAPAADKNTVGLVITPFVSVTAPTRDGAAICSPVNDALTQRPSGVACRPSAGDDLSLAVNLLGGNDSLDLSTHDAPLTAVTVEGGAGNDLLLLRVESTKTVRGGDGDDTLAAVTRRATGATLDGGLGRDLVDYAGQNQGVNLNLATGRTTVLIQPPEGPSGSATRTDVLAGIERAAGSASGDILTGGPGPDELIGNDGPDALDGGSGTDVLSGGTGSDRLQGGRDADTIDGGSEIDEFPAQNGGDLFQMRDGSPETVQCFAGDRVVNDLVDRFAGVCAAVDAAAAKHRFDTRILRISRSGVARVRCPKRKTELCTGTLRVRRGGGTLASVRYRVRRDRTVSLNLGRSIGRGKVTLLATEIDADRRPRSVRVTLRPR